METKNMIIIAVVVVIIAILGVVFATGMLNGDDNKNVVTTPFKTDFMEGRFVGDVDLEFNDNNMICSYVDDENGITYNISTVDDTESLMKIYEAQGVTNPTEVTLNGNDWNVYFTDAIPDGSNEEDTMNIIICQSQDEKQGYLIYAIVDSDSDNIDHTLDESNGVYPKFVKPLLKSITLKETDKVPKINEEFGLSEDEFQHEMDKISSMT